MLYGLFAVLIIIVSILLVLIVLVQNSKGGGLAANFASANQTFGVRQTADILEKWTWYLVIAIFVFCFAATSTISDNTVRVQRESAVQKQIGGSMILNQEFPVTATQGQEEQPTAPQTETDPE